MNSILRVWVLCAISLAGLAGCGGGGDGAAAADESGLPPASACLPTTEAPGSRVAARASYAETVEQMGCEGRMVSETFASGESIRMYDWGQVTSGPYVLMEFRNDQLLGWTSKGVYDAAPAGCLPTRAAVDRLATGMDLAEVSEVIGCTGQTISHSVDYSGLWGTQSNLAWGDIASGPYLMVTIKDNSLSSFSSQRL